MNYETHLLKLIETRNKREHLFRDIIQDYNQLYQEFREVTKRSEKLEHQYEELKTDHHKLKEMTNVTIDSGNLIVKDDYFPS